MRLRSATGIAANEAVRVTPVRLPDFWNDARVPPRSRAELAVNRRQFRGMRAAALTAVLLVFIALVLWGVGLLAGFNADCGAGPRGGKGASSPTGLDTHLSVWPPGQSCEYGAAGGRGDHVAQPLGWIKTSIIAVATLALVMLLLGLFSLIRYRRREADDPERALL